MDEIIISHVAETNPARFEVWRHNGQHTSTVELPSPSQFPVQDRPMHFQISSDHPAIQPASADEQSQLRTLWQEAGLPPLPETIKPE